MINYDREMQKIISGLNGKKPKLLLHACCAPCASAVIERLKDIFDLTVWFYNPNISSFSEYVKRELELKRLCEHFDVNFQSENYDAQDFYSNVVGLEDEKEGGARCVKCFYLRLMKSGEKAKSENFDFFTTTLTISPLKNAELLNSIGQEVSKKLEINFLPSDFKKKGGYLRSIELSRELNLYRQNFCGCVFSQNKNPN